MSFTSTAFVLLLQLVYFSDKTTQGLAAENSDLREQLDRVRGQLVKARNATKTATVKDSCHGKGRVSGGEGGKGGGEREVGRGDSGEGGKVEVYRAQIKDLNKRLAQLEEVHTCPCPSHYKRYIHVHVHPTISTYMSMSIPL